MSRLGAALPDETSVASIGRPLRRDLEYFDVDVPGEVFERLLDVSHETIRRRANDGALVKAGRGRFAFIESLRQYFGHLERVSSGRGGQEEQAVLAHENALLARARRESQELKNARDRAELVSALEVEATWTADWKKASQAVLGITSRLATECPHLNRADLNALDKLIRQTLTRLGDIDE